MGALTEGSRPPDRTTRRPCKQTRARAHECGRAASLVACRLSAGRRQHEAETAAERGGGGRDIHELADDAALQGEVGVGERLREDHCGPLLAAAGRLCDVDHARDCCGAKPPPRARRGSHGRAVMPPLRSWRKADAAWQGKMRKKSRARKGRKIPDRMDEPNQGFHFRALEGVCASAWTSQAGRPAWASRVTSGGGGRGRRESAAN